MRLDIKKTENGYHVTDADNGEMCYQTAKCLFDCIEKYLPVNVGDEIIIKNSD